MCNKDKKCTVQMQKSLNNYLYFPEEARLVQLLGTSNISTAAIQKPEKIYLNI